MLDIHRFSVIAVCAALLLTSSVLAAAADRYTYVGGGRYTCDGKSCGVHDAQQAARDRAEVEERDRRDAERSRRERIEREEITRRPFDR